MRLTTKKFAIDLGNNKTLLADEQKVLASHPSFVAVDRQLGKPVAVGSEAYRIFEKHPDRMKTVQPLRWGVIADYESARWMIGELVKQHCALPWWQSFDHIVAGVPSAATEVEKRALRDALAQFPARRTHILFEPLAAAMGMGLNIHSSDAKLVVDIGGGITEIAVISLSGLVVLRSTKVAGDAMTAAIQDYVRQAHHVTIGWRTAESVKMEIGTVHPHAPNAQAMAKGKCLREGLPVVIRLSSHELAEVLDRAVQSIEDCLRQVLEVCPPELSADLYQGGIYLTGGGSLLNGIPERIARRIGIPVHVDPHPLVSVGLGIGKALRAPKALGPVLVA